MTGETPAVSVLMPTFNRAAFVGPAIESVLTQRFTDFELIVVDDASTDATAQATERYSVDPRVRFVRNDRNLGQFANRNRAATLARGRYLKYHDSDDVMYPHCLEIMVGLLEQEPRAGFGLSTSRAWYGGPAPMFSTPRESYEREFMGYGGVFMCGPGCGLYRTDVFRALGGWPDEGVQSDTLFLMRALARYPVLLLPGDLFWYRTHTSQALTSAAAARDYARVPGAVWRMLASSECPLDQSQREVARRALAWTIAKSTWRDVKAGRLALAGYRLHHAELGAADWFRYFGRPARTESAGAPRSGSGEVVLPGWVQLRRERGA